MKYLTKTGCLFYGLAMAGIGFQQLYYADFHPMILPPHHTWIPGLAICAYVTGVLLLLAGLAIAFNYRGKKVALWLGGILLLLFVVYYLPYMLIADKYYMHLGEWVNAEKELALCGGAFVTAGVLQSPAGTKTNSIISLLEKCIPLGRIFFCITMISFGIDHFLYTKGIALLIPAWVGHGVFWTIFAGAALIASGVAILLKFKLNITASLLGIMIFCWLFMLHIPRSIAQPTDNMGNEVTSAFSALAFSGIAFAIAGMQPSVKK